MIYIFRKEMKKWHTVLWVVFVSLAVSGISFIFFSPAHRHELTIAKVNGERILFDEYTRSLSDLHERISALRPYAQMYGMSDEAFISSILGPNTPEEIALDVCVKDKLIDIVKKTCSIRIDEEWFKTELIKTLPHLMDESGQINMDAYHRYLQKLSMTPTEYERQREEDLKREAVNRFVHNTAYVPRFVAKEIFDHEHSAKSFKILEIPFDYFVKEAHQQEINDKELELFYLKNKEAYRVGEKQKTKYWFISPEDYAKKIEVDDQTIQAFYEKNKSTLYRLAPKIKVRHILLKVADKSKQATTDVYIRAQQILKEVKANPKKFADLAKQYSEAANAKDGGETGFFGKQTFDTEFERAAFRLQKEGEVSDIVKTKEGYQIIQLAQRQAASEKPLDVVRDDIIKAIKTRKTQHVLRSDLERLIHLAREDKKAFEKFAEASDLEGHQSGWLTEENLKESGLEGLLAKKLFSQKQQHVGYFAFEDKYVLFQQSEREKSYIPLLNQVNEQVIEDYYQDRANEIAKQKIKGARAALIDKKATIEELAQQFGRSITTTKEVEKGEKIAGFDKVGNMSEAAFVLNDSIQVLYFMHQQNSYLIQLNEFEVKAGKSFDQEMAKIIKQEKFKSNNIQLAAFIASLHRNAKIEIDEKLLEGYKKQVKD